MCLRCLIFRRGGGDGIYALETPDGIYALETPEVKPPSAQTPRGRLHPTHWGSIQWNKTYELNETEAHENPAHLEASLTHGLAFVDSFIKPPKKTVRRSLQKQLKCFRKNLKRYRRSLRVKKDQDNPKPTPLAEASSGNPSHPSTEQEHPASSKQESTEPKQGSVEPEQE